MESCIIILLLFSTGTLVYFFLVLCIKKTITDLNSQEDLMKLEVGRSKDNKRVDAKKFLKDMTGFNMNG